MAILNLLPYKARENLKHRVSAEVLLFGVFLAGVMVFDAVILLSVDASMKYTLYQLKGETQTVEADRGLHPIQTEANDLALLQREQVFVARRLADLSRLRPAGVDITDLQLTAEDGRIVMKGAAASVDLANAMKDALDRSGAFTDSALDLQDLDAAGGARFTLEARTSLTGL